MGYLHMCRFQLLLKEHTCFDPPLSLCFSNTFLDEIHKKVFNLSQVFGQDFVALFYPFMFRSEIIPSFISKYAP